MDILIKIMKSAFLNILPYGALHNIKGLSYKLTSLSYIGGYIIKNGVITDTLLI